MKYTRVSAYPNRGCSIKKTNKKISAVFLKAKSITEINSGFIYNVVKYGSF